MNANAIPLLAIALFLSLLAGNQYFGISKDVDQYNLFFDNLSDNYVGRFEPLFVYFSLAIKWLTSSFAFYLFALAFAGISLKIYVLYQYRFFYLSLMWYLLILFPLHELTQYRAAISLGILYLSFHMLSLRKKTIYPLLLFTASVFFHYSAIAFLPFILFWGVLTNARVKNFVYAVIAIFFLALAKTAITSFVGDLNSTVIFHDGEDPSLFSSRNIILSTVVILGILGFKSIPKNSRPFIYVSIYGFVLWWLFYDLPVFAHRLFEATFMSYFIWLGFLSGAYRFFSMILMSIFALYLAYSAFYSNPLFS